MLDGVPNDPYRPKRTVIRLGDGDSALLVGEGEARLAGGKLLIGHWRYTAELERFDAAEKALQALVAHVSIPKQIGGLAAGARRSQRG